MYRLEGYIYTLNHQTGKSKMMRINNDELFTPDCDEDANYFDYLAFTEYEDAAESLIYHAEFLDYFSNKYDKSVHRGIIYDFRENLNLVLNSALHKLNMSKDEFISAQENFNVNISETLSPLCDFTYQLYNESPSASNDFSCATLKINIRPNIPINAESLRKAGYTLEDVGPTYELAVKIIDGYLEAEQEEY